MIHPSWRNLALAVLAFMVPALVPRTASAAKVRPTSTSRAAVSAALAVQAVVRVDTVTRMVPVDSVALRRAIDAASKRAIDSVLAQASEDRRQWTLVIYGLLALGGVFLVLLVWDMVRGHDVMVESHWGGFGGGVGGTRLSRALVLTVLLLLTGGMLTVLAVARPGRVRVVESDAKRDTTRVARQDTTARQPAPTQPPATSPAGRTTGN